MEIFVGLTFAVDVFIKALSKILKLKPFLGHSVAPGQLSVAPFTNVKNNLKPKHTSHFILALLGHDFFCLIFSKGNNFPN